MMPLEVSMEGVPQVDHRYFCMSAAAKWEKKKTLSKPQHYKNRFIYNSVLALQELKVSLMHTNLEQILNFKD